LAIPNIKNEIRKLVDLQEVDKKIFVLNKEEAKMPARMQELLTAFEAKKAKLKSIEENRQKLMLRQKDREGELASKEEGIKKSQSQLGQLKTNKDYQVKMTEIEGFKADKSIFEEEILKLMDDNEAAKRDADIEKKNLESEEKSFDEKKSALASRLKEIEGLLSDLEGKRKMLADSVDKKILERYEHILHGKDGLAMVMVKDNSCHGCFLKVPHQVINEIKMHERLITCEICARILYLEEDLVS
jgi:predicted  nucleic acid-binding Zn-ribbon protein